MVFEPPKIYEIEFTLRGRATVQARDETAAVETAQEEIANVIDAMAMECEEPEIVRAELIDER